MNLEFSNDRLHRKHRSTQKTLFFKKKLNTISDQELLARYRSDGQSKWMGEIYERYGHLVYGLCLKYLKDKEDARDATIHLFEKLMFELRSRDVFNFTAWLHTVSRNHCLSLIRARTSQQKQYKAYTGTILLYDLQPIGEFSDVELKEHDMELLEGAVSQLNLPQQNCLRLFYLEEKSYKEISDLTGISINEVKSHLQNGRRNLKNLLQINE